MKISKASVIYGLLVNLPVVFWLCLTASLSANTTFADGTMTIAFKNINWISYLINFAMCYVLAMIISVFVPLTRIGRWFTGLFGIETVSYRRNMPYRLLAVLSITVVYYCGITPATMILNHFILGNSTIGEALLNVVENAPIMLLVGFVSSLISDVFANKVAHRVDPTF